MTEAERKRLLESMPLAPSPLGSRQLKLKLMAEAVGVVLAVVILIAVKKVPVAVAILGALAFLAIWWLLYFKSRVLSPLRKSREANERVSRFRAAVDAAKTIRVHRIESDDVVQVAHDDGTICLFDVGGNRTFWIDPCFMVPGRPPEDWPNRKFEVVAVPAWPDEIGPFCSGKKLQPRETFEFRDLFEHYTYDPPPDGLINEPLDAFLKCAQERNRSEARVPS